MYRRRFVTAIEVTIGSAAAISKVVYPMGTVVIKPWVGGVDQKYRVQVNNTFLFFAEYH